MSDSKILKPCPFCGSARVDGRFIRDGWRIGCLDCGAGVGAFHPAAHTRSAEKWNRRTAPPSTHMAVWKPVPYEHEITLQASREASTNVDDADPRRVLLAVLGCAETWTPSARIIGNVRAGDISIAIRAALATTEGEEL